MSINPLDNLESIYHLKKFIIQAYVFFATRTVLQVEAYGLRIYKANTVSDTQVKTFAHGFT